MTDLVSRYEVERAEEWGKWKIELPFLKFKEDWEVKIIPPVVGAIVRFLVRKNNKEVSVYFDAYDRLGVFGAPYWEIYPYEDDVRRFEMKDTVGLLKGIEESLG